MGLANLTSAALRRRGFFSTGADPRNAEEWHNRERCPYHGSGSRLPVSQRQLGPASAGLFFVPELFAAEILAWLNFCWSMIRISVRWNQGHSAMLTTDATTIDQLARALISSQGRMAAEVAKRTARSLESLGDHEGATRWRLVADAARAQLIG